ncbi:MAG: hypothetical protein R3199_05335 [Gemmatimonadota bacterium]|nr:hypothetical protein [Gemmatimonadota bacterium]
MATFVDHLQLLPVPSVGGVRQPDGDHRPGGLGLFTLADRLVERGWTARVEDIGFDREMPELRVAEAYARSIGDAVASAWDRDRFPVLLSRVNYGALGVVDALGSRTGLLWIGPRAEYRRPGLLRRPAVDRTALSLVTGRAERDPFAVEPVRLDASRVVVVDARDVSGSERRALVEDGASIVSPASAEIVAERVAGIDADRWYAHLDLRALAGEAAPAADEGYDDGLDPELAAEIVAEALGDREIGCVGYARYDLNRDVEERTASTLVELIESAVLAAGGRPRPEAVGEAR